MKLRLPQGEVVLDPFSGRSLARSELDEFLDPWRTQSQQPLALESFLGSASSRQILARMLRNLRQIHQQGRDLQRLLRVQQRLVILLPRDEQEQLELARCQAQLHGPGEGEHRLH